MMNFTLSNQVQIPAVGIGTFMMTPDQAEQAVVDALACGYRMIDTAQAYMNERAVGRGIKRSGVAREDIFISTKIWASQYLTEGTVEKSLELLGTDYIDLMFIHQPAGDFMAGYRKLETVAIRPMVNQIEMHTLKDTYGGNDIMVGGVCIKSHGRVPDRAGGMGTARRRTPQSV